MKAQTKPLKPVVPKALGHWQLLQHWVVQYLQTAAGNTAPTVSSSPHQKKKKKKKLEISPIYIVPIAITKTCSEH